ncbi:hypothetical protein ACE2AJ_00695 [Aquihabitans daechungensis]|uniref:hypothetical protein n=1 Tax=Aquihabitans daechungensis TaxID=1052257 RepID=UPI003B9F1010
MSTFQANPLSTIDDRSPADRALPRGMSRPERGLIQATEVFAERALAIRALPVATRWLARPQATEVRTPVAVTADELRRWVDEPMEDLAERVTSQRGTAGLAEARRVLQEDLEDAVVITAPLHPSAALGRWWFSPTLDEVVQVDGWVPVDEGLAEIDAVLLVACTRTLASHDLTIVSALGEVLADGWHPDEADALAPLWGANRTLRPSTVILLALLRAWDRRDLDALAVPVPAHADRDLEELFEQFAPRGTIDLAEADERLRIARADDTSGCERAVAAIDEALARTQRRRTEGAARRRTATLVATALILWLGATWGLDPASMSDLGLVSILRPTGYVAVGFLVLALILEIAAPRPSTGRLAAPIVALVAVLHGTPSVLYGTLRYSWAWKHLGIVDYISRNNGVDPTVPALDIYHSWPGFFSVNSTAVDVLGLSSASGYARWWPVLANLAVIPVLLLVYRGLGGSAGRRTAWLAVAIFLAANWIGQDYFSPQSMAYLLYLLIIGIVLQFTASERGVTGAERPGRWAVAIALLAGAALVTSHQITPIILVMALGALALLRQRRVLLLAVSMVAMTVLWAATGAWTYMEENLSSLLDGFGDPASNAEKNLVDRGGLSPDQVLVSTLGRVALLVIAVLAVVGFVRQLRGRTVDLTALALLLAPAGLIFANSFGGEIGFRTYLFALPFLAWYAAQAFWPSPPGGAIEAPAAPSRRSVVIRSVAAFAAVTVLLAGFAFGYYGKDRYYRFAEDEVAASAYILDRAPNGSLLVTVSANYPGLWRNYDHVTPVPIAREPEESLDRILADPLASLTRWLEGDEYTDGYVLLTRSQEREVEALGDLPPGAYEDLRRALDTSPRFTTVWATPNATIYQLTR